MIDKDLLNNIVENFDFSALFAATTKSVSEQLKKKITAETLEGIHSFYLTGCGDSLFEAYAVQGVFEKYTGVRTEVLEALEFTRYRAGFIPGGAAVFCISNSGGASRTVESVLTANEIGALSIAVSGSDDSPLAQHAKLLIHRPVPQFPEVKGNCNRVVRNMAEYVLSIHVLDMIALHIARIRGNITDRQHDELLGQLMTLPERVHRTAEEVSGPVSVLAETCRGEKDMFFLGAGPNYSNALFGCAKLHEDVPVNGIAEWMEEWAHLQYFLSLNETHKTPVVLVAPKGVSRKRADEIAESCESMEVPVVELRSAGDDTPVRKNVLPLYVRDEELCELFTPAVFCVPLQLLGIYWALEVGRESVPRSRADEYRLIRGSEIQVGYLK